MQIFPKTKVPNESRMATVNRLEREREEWNIDQREQSKFDTWTWKAVPREEFEQWKASLRKVTPPKSFLDKWKEEPLMNGKIARIIRLILGD